MNYYRFFYIHIEKKKNKIIVIPGEIMHDKNVNKLENKNTVDPLVSRLYIREMHLKR